MSSATMGSRGHPTSSGHQHAAGKKKGTHVDKDHRKHNKSQGTGEPTPGNTPIPRLSKGIMGWLVDNEHLEEDWQTKRHLHLNFSDPQFRLEIFRPYDFHWGNDKSLEEEDGKQVDKRKTKIAKDSEQAVFLNVSHLQSLNLDSNLLQDNEFDNPKQKEQAIDSACFPQLRTLRMKNNSLQNPHIKLSNLRELHLAHNKIWRIPKLDSVKQLEILNLSYNEIGDVDHYEEFKHVEKLQTLDLSHNSIHVKPSLWRTVLDDGLARTKSLTNFQVKENPFCCYFNEYQMLTIWRLKSLIRIDDVNLNKKAGMRESLEKQARDFFGREYIVEEEKIDDLTKARADLKKKAIEELQRELQRETGMNFQARDGEQEAAKLFLKAGLERMDEKVQTRRDAIKSFVDKGAASMQDEGKVETKMPQLTQLIQILDDALADQSLVTANVALAFNLASLATSMGVSDYSPMFEDIKMADAPTQTAPNQKKPKKDKNNPLKAEHSALFAQQAKRLAERYPQSRLLLARTLAKFCCVAEHKLSDQCLSALGALAIRDEDSMTLVLDVLREMVIPTIEQSAMSKGSSRAIIVGLSKFDTPRLAELLRPAIKPLCIHLKTVMDHNFPDEKQAAEQGGLLDGLYTLLSNAVQDKDNASTVLSQNTAAKIVTKILRDDGSAIKESGQTKSFLNSIRILRWIFNKCPEDMMAKFKESETALFHTNLLKVVGKTLDPVKTEVKGQNATTHGGTDKLGKSACKKLAAVLDFLSDLLSLPDKGNDLMNFVMSEAEKSTTNYLVGILTSICQEESPDPVLMTSALNMLATILRKEEWRKKHLDQVVKGLCLCSDQNKIIPYIAPKKFKELYLKCEEHTSDDVSEVASVGLSAAVPDLNGATNPFVHAAIVAIVDFLRVFSRFASVDEDCEKVQKELDKCGRDRLLFKLLEIPSTTVQTSVMECLDAVDSSELDDEEKRSLVSMLNPAVIARQESLLVAVIQRLLMIMEEPGASADVFRSTFAHEVIKKTIEVLVKNSGRNTYKNKEEEEQKLNLSMQAVSLLHECSKNTLLRKYFRNPFVGASFPRILRNEEDLHDWQMEDVCIELTWSGRDVEYMMACLAKKEESAANQGIRLDPRKKQAFRILHRLADMVMGYDDANGAPPPISAHERASTEARMWHAYELRLQVASLDEEIYEDRTKQQESFVSFDGMHRVLFFLESHPMGGPTQSESDGLLDPATKLKLEADQTERESIEVLRRLRQHAEDRELDEKKKLEEQKRNDKAEMIDFDTDEVETAQFQERMKQTFMQESWKPRDRPPIEGFDGLIEPSNLMDRNYFMIPHKPGEVAPAYLMAAFLRAVFCLLSVPAVEFFREEMTNQLRQSGLLLRIMNLIKRFGNLVQCHVAAKFMRVLSCVLRLDPTKGTAEGEPYLVCLSIAANFATQCLRDLTPCLQSLGRAYLLSHSKEMLGKESIRLLRTVTYAACCTRFSASQEIQAECLELSLSSVVSMDAVRAAFLLILYDMQVNIGSSHGSNINDRFVRSSLDRQGLRELCVDLLSVVLNFCPRNKYDAIEFFTRKAVLGRNMVRESFLYHLMREVEMKDYHASMEKILVERAGDTKERILQCVEVELPNVYDGLSMRMGGKQPPRQLLLTNKRLLVMGRPRHSRLKQPCGICPPTSFCPIGPTEERNEDYRDISRIIVAPDTQMFVVGWIGDRRRGKRDVGEERFDIVICHKSNSREYVVQCLSALTGPGIETRVEPQTDLFVQRAINQNTNGTPLVMSWGYRHSAFITKGDRLYLFILCEMEFLEFDVNWDSWVSPPEEMLDPVDDEVKALLAHQQGAPDVTHPSFDDPVAKFRQSSRGRLPYNTKSSQWLHKNPNRNKGNVGEEADSIQKLKEEREQSIQLTEEKLFAKYNVKSNSDAEQPNAKVLIQRVNKAAQKTFFRNIFKKSLRDLEEVTFEPGEEAILTLRFSSASSLGLSGSEDVCLRFTDDVARERWRRAIAFALNKNFADVQWKRQF